MLISIQRTLQRLTASRHAVVAVAMIGLCGGCGGEGSPHPVDSELARQTLRKVLESWKAGESIESWPEQSPPVVVQDMDWLSGQMLEEFELLDEGSAVDANLHAQVRLTLRSKDSQSTSEKTVTYLVSTSPHLTVFRQIMQ